MDVKIESDNKSKLELKKLYFNKIYFEQKEINEKSLLMRVNYNIEYEEDQNNVNKTNVKINTVIRDENELTTIELTCIGIFELKGGKGLSEEDRKSIVKINTVAIMMPYIRSQVTLLTAQPNMMPFLLPAVDVNEMVAAKDK